MVKKNLREIINQIEDKKEVVKKEKKSVVFNEQDNEVIIGTERKWNDAYKNKAAFV